MKLFHGFAVLLSTLPRHSSLVTSPKGSKSAKNHLFIISPDLPHYPRMEYPTTYWIVPPKFSFNSSSTCSLASCFKTISSPTSPKTGTGVPSHPVTHIRNLCCFDSCLFLIPHIQSIAKYYEWCLSRSSWIHLLFFIATIIALVRATNSRNFLYGPCLMTLQLYSQREDSTTHISPWLNS